MLDNLWVALFTLKTLAYSKNKRIFLQKYNFEKKLTTLLSAVAGKIAITIGYLSNKPATSALETSATETSTSSATRSSRS